MILITFATSAFGHAVVATSDIALSDMLDLQALDLHLLPLTICGKGRNAELNSEGHAGSVPKSTPVLAGLTMQARSYVCRLGVVRSDIEPKLTEQFLDRWCIESAHQQLFDDFLKVDS